MKNVIICAVLMLFVSACATTETKTQVTRTQSGTDTPQKPLDKLAFFDSVVFDKELSLAMQSSESLIEVTPIAKFSPNDVPGRMAKWFYEIDQNGGSIETEDIETNKRGLIGEGIDLVLKIKEGIHNKKLYGPAAQYNAVVYYNQNDGMVNKVCFERKTEKDAGK